MKGDELISLALNQEKLLILADALAIMRVSHANAEMKLPEGFDELEEDVAQARGVI